MNCFHLYISVLPKGRFLLLIMLPEIKQYSECFKILQALNLLSSFAIGDSEIKPEFSTEA